MNDANAVMIDLETMATGPNAGVIQIAAWPFNTETGLASVDPFSIDVSLQTCLLDGGEADRRTIEWWREQVQAGVPFPAVGVPIREALDRLRDWFGGQPDEARWNVWAQGPSFDVAILEGYYKRTGSEPPWRYNAARDTRTIYWLARSMGWEKPPETIAHHEAAEDCRRQIIALTSALEHIRGRCPVEPGGEPIPLQG